MEAMFLLIAISVVFVVGIGVAFWWAIFAGQFDNSDSAGESILHDDEDNPGPEPRISRDPGTDTGAAAPSGTKTRLDGKGRQDGSD